MTDSTPQRTEIEDTYCEGWPDVLEIVRSLTRAVEELRAENDELRDRIESLEIDALRNSG